MQDQDPQYAAVRAFVDELVRVGVRHVCVSPGARSTPLTLTVADTPGLRAWSHVDERSGAFFGLGLAKVSRQPVALVCTSGTAAANFFPAVIEAAHAHVPLLVLTADRPPELRDCGAAQTIDQIKLYGSHVKWFAEAGGAEAGLRYFRTLACRAVAAAEAGPAGPVHVNFPFREPLVPATAAATPPEDYGRAHTISYHAAAAPTATAVTEVAGAIAAARRGIILCGIQDGDENFPSAVTALAERTGFPVLADPLSQLRTGPHDQRLVVGAYDALLRHEPFAAGMGPDLVLRFGSMPTSKPCTVYLERHRDARHIVVEPYAFWSDPGLLASEIVRADPAGMCSALLSRLAAREPGDWPRRWMDADRRARAAIEAHLAATAELFEGRVFQELASALPDGAIVYTGNSMPVRDQETFWPLGTKRVRFLCNRGANGIDGFASSGLGAAAATDAPVVMVTGDLGFYHDLNGLLAVKRHRLRATIVVLNNDGGGIFSFLPQAACGTAFEEFFGTPHGLDFRGAVEMYGARFERVADWEQFRTALSGSIGAAHATVIEVPVDRARNVQLHRDVWAAVGKALTAA